jgi:hypothetical protein
MNTPKLLIPLLLLTSCGPVSKFKNSTSYTEQLKPRNIFVIVVADKDTKNCLNYYQGFLIDSLKRNHVETNGTYYCCRDKNTKISDVIRENLPMDNNFTHILAVVITKTIVGYGNTSSRELELDLFSTADQKKIWKGSLAVSMSWFISEDNYREVARKLNETTIKEFKNQGIL